MNAKYGASQTINNVPNDFQFLGAFAKIAKSDYYFRHVCLSIRPSAWNNSPPTEGIFSRFYICVFFENLSRRFKFL
jgi:hypothetical protein